MTPRFPRAYQVFACVPLNEDTLPRIPLSRLIERGKCECSNCGIKATHVATYYETTNPEAPIVTNVFAQLPDASMRMMTKDHILPRLLGGTNFQGNLQVMCYICNSRKSCYMTEAELALVRANPTRHMQMNCRVNLTVASRDFPASNVLTLLP